MGGRAVSRLSGVGVVHGLGNAVRVRNSQSGWAWGKPNLSAHAASPASGTFSLIMNHSCLKAISEIKSHYGNVCLAIGVANKALLAIAEGSTGDEGWIAKNALNDIDSVLGYEKNKYR